MKQREIKFRAWDEAQMMMHHWNYLRTWAPKDWNQIDVEAMQFTGLHDKNGTEIYEGDIVSGDTPPFSIKGVVEYGKGYYGIQTGKTESDKLVQLNPNTPFGSNFIEVIGNIYENPNLLTPTKE